MKRNRPINPNHAGVLDNDLPGYVFIRKNRKKIVIRYRGVEYSSGFNNTTGG